jgi:8-oxo-dGTP pyrophosphatase MutT (NUDIX family)
MIEDVLFIEQLKGKLSEELPGIKAHQRMIPNDRKLPLHVPENAKHSGVMILLYDLDSRWNTVLIRRTEDGHTHSGQISFPGGRKDHTDIDIIHTAKRECEEEIGVPMSDIDVLGTLSDVYIPPSNFLVTPTIGYIKNLRQFKASEREVQEIIQLPLELLFHQNIKSIREVRPSSNPQSPIKTPVYALADDLIVWGATAMMIAELEEIIISI